MVEAPKVLPLPKVTLAQLPLTGAASLEVNMAVLAVKVPYTFILSYKIAGLVPNAP